MNMPIINSGPAHGASDLSGAAARYFFDPAGYIPLGIALLLSIAAFIVMSLYVRTISRGAQSGTPPEQSVRDAEEGAPDVLPAAIGPLEIQIAEPSEAGRPALAQSPTFQHAGIAFRRAALVYALGGCVHAATSVLLLFLFGFYSFPSISSHLTMLGCYGALFWSWYFISIVALALFCGPDWRLRGILVMGYLAMLPAMGVGLELAGAPALRFVDVGLIAKDQAELVLSFASKVLGRPVTAESVRFSALTQPILFWGLSGVPLLVPLFAFNRFIRGTVGPVFINLALMMVLSTFVIIDLFVNTSPGRWLTVHIKKTFVGNTLAVLYLIGLTLSAVIACFGLLWIGRRYRRRQVSDQTFLFDALWLSASFWVSIYLINVRYPFIYLLGILPFVLYKITVGHGLKRIAKNAEPLRKARLLFLRVFGSSRRSEKLFDLLAARWRYAGSIQLLSAPDLARTRFEPDEFLDFFSGRLAKSYINDITDVDRLLAGLNLQLDPDGRYRVNEFFCRINTWQQTVKRLMAQSDLVAMDLRAFTAQKKGCIF